MSNEANNQIPPLESEIINNKKQLILKVDQEYDFVYPNQKYRYQIYCKNISGSCIKNVKIQVTNPENVLIAEDDGVPFKGVEIGHLRHGESQLIYLDARCSKVGKYSVHVICFGDQTGLFTKQLNITCNYNGSNGETIHRLHVYDFTPYEDTYELRARDYNDQVTQLHKVQKLPNLGLFKPIHINIDNVDQDESETYVKQYHTLYDNQETADEHTYQYLARENFNKDGIEAYEGKNLIDLFEQINENSKIFRVTPLKIGTNQLLNNLQGYNPDGFIYRFGLLSSELYHHIGVLPNFSHMSDYLMRWAPDASEPKFLYPKRIAMNWDTKKWAGHGWNVWKTYTDEYKNEIINTDDYEPLFECVGTFDDYNTTQEFVNRMENDSSESEYYTQINNEETRIRKYQYLIKESYFTDGVFYIDIPLDKIPTNFHILETEEIEALAQRTKPYGLKPLIRYTKNIRFDHELDLHMYTKIKPQISLDLGEYDPLTYYIQPYKYRNIIENVCYDTNNGPVYKERSALRLIPDGIGWYNGFRVNMKQDVNFITDNAEMKRGLENDLDIESKTYVCNMDNNLTTVSQIQELLYQNNFESISFFVDDIVPLTAIASKNEEPVLNRDQVNYQLWIDSLYPKNTDNSSEVNQHAYWWDIELNTESEKEEYIINTNQTNRVQQIDFFEIPLENFQLIQDDVESGIGFEDTTGKLHGLSVEFDPIANQFKVQYATSLNQNFKIKKQGLADIVGAAYQIIRLHKQTMIIFYIKKNESNDIKYHYFEHVIVPNVRSIFCFIRNTTDISTIQKWSNLVRISSTNDPIINFNTPQYFDYDIYDPTQIKTENIYPWEHINRIDRNEHSYANQHNTSTEIQPVDNIILHFDNINIPDDAIVKDVIIESTLESNMRKTLYYSNRIQDGFITQDSKNNSLILYPDNIETYPINNNNIGYYQHQYDVAEAQNVTNILKNIQNKITENELFNEAIDPSLEFLDDIDVYYTIRGSYWHEINGFTEMPTLLSDLNQMVFYIEGYNHGSEVNLFTQIHENNMFAEITQTRIPSGYFKKYIHINMNEKFLLNNINLRFRFENLHHNIDIFDLYIEPKFINKQEIEIEFANQNNFDIESKKMIEFNINESLIPAYILNNGLSIKLEFDDLEPGEYYRIYSMNLKIVYQKQSIDLLINSTDYEFNQYDNNLICVGGQKNAPYMSGMFFNDLPSVSQLESTSNIDNLGIELSDALYQSFVAKSDNITSITLYPNGFIGNPSSNLKIALYTNQYNTPGELIKEIRASGWTKNNDKLKTSKVISYNFNVNNLEIDKTYWLKISVDETRQNSHYLLHYIDSPRPDLKLLTRINNNLINVFGSLKFQINSINLYNSFNNIPMTQDIINNPNIFVGINRGQGYIRNLKVQKLDTIANQQISSSLSSFPPLIKNLVYTDYEIQFDTVNINSISDLNGVIYNLRITDHTIEYDEFEIDNVLTDNDYELLQTAITDISYEADKSITYTTVGDL